MSKRITEREAEQLRKAAYEQKLNKVLAFSKKRFKKFSEVIEHIYQRRNIDELAQVDGRIKKLAACFDKLEGGKHQMKRLAFKAMLLHLDGCSALLKDADFVDAVFNIFSFQPHWLQSIYCWRPLVKQPAAQLEELAAHLFCKYRLPEFMFKALFDTGNKIYMRWLVHLGSGGRVKHMPEIPIPFTQKMAHHFLQVPAKFSIKEGLRWAQVKGLGGSNVMAEKVAYSWIGIKPFDNEIFWEHFLQLVSGDSMLNPDKAGELIDYVREAKRLDSGYSLKGRTIQSLVRQSDEWHRRFNYSKGNQVWKPSGIEGWKEERKREGEKEVFRLEELRETRMLVQEGKTMHHCVASYSFYCAKGKTTIFSLRKYTGDLLSDTLATIEVSLGLRRIVQAKGKMNKPISDQAKKILLNWAAAQQLDVSPYL